MELIEPDGSGPVPSRIGTYELVAFTKYKVGDEATKTAFEEANLRIRNIFTIVGRYSHETQLNLGETAELPGIEGEPGHHVIFDQFVTPGADFIIGDRKHGLLLVIEVFKSEMEHTKANGSQLVLDELKMRGHYPYSDLDREPVL